MPTRRSQQNVSGVLPDGSKRFTTIPIPANYDAQVNEFSFHFYTRSVGKQEILRDLPPCGKLTSINLRRAFKLLD